MEFCLDVLGGIRWNFSHRVEFVLSLVLGGTIPVIDPLVDSYS